MIIYNPIKGKHIPLKDVPDPVFSEKMMGDGSAIHPEGNIVVAPISGHLTTVFPTRHAFGIEGDNGEEVLIHIGINTVELNGEHFELLVEQGDYVNVGDPLVNVDFDAIAQAGYSTITPIIVLNTSEFSSVDDCGGGSMDSLVPLLKLIK